MFTKRKTNNYLLNFDPVRTHDKVDTNYLLNFDPVSTRDKVSSILIFFVISSRWSERLNFETSKLDTYHHLIYSERGKDENVMCNLISGIIIY